MANIYKNMEITSFRKGLRELKVKDYPDAKAKIMEAIGINNRTSFSSYADGKTQMKVDQYKAVEAVFASYGIRNCWGR